MDKRDYARNIAPFLAAVGAVNVGGGISSSCFTLWSIDVLAGGSDALATEYVLLAVFAYGAANLVGAPLTASLADLLGRRPMLVATLALAGVSGAVTWLVPRLWVFVALSALQGLLTVYSTIFTAVLVDTARAGASGADLWAPQAADDSAESAPMAGAAATPQGYLPPKSTLWAPSSLKIISQSVTF